MADLRAALTDAGLADVETVVASGNVIFSLGRRRAATYEKTIAGLLETTFGIASFVAVRSADEVRSAIRDNPFHGVGPEHGEDRFVHTTFLDRQPSPDRFEALLAEQRGKGRERLALGERMLFLDYVHGAAGSRLTGPFLERRLDCRGTARNMRSLKRILGKMS